MMLFALVSQFLGNQIKPLVTAVMPIALTDSQMTEMMAVGRHVPRHLRDEYLKMVAALLQGREVGDADVWRACHAAATRVVEQAHRKHLRATEDDSAPLRP
jgi:hypothetical protein